MKIAIIMGSDSDWDVMKQATAVLDEFEVAYEAKVVSAHRTPEDMIAFAKDAVGNGFNAIIAGAGGAAHLPGMVASCTTLPVVGVPIKSSSLSGLDSLLSIVQMPKGIPVATVAINNAANAALLALRMLSISCSQYREKMDAYMQEMKEMSRAKTLD